MLLSYLLCSFVSSRDRLLLCHLCRHCRHVELVLHADVWLVWGAVKFRHISEHMLCHIIGSNAVIFPEFSCSISVLGVTDPFTFDLWWTGCSRAWALTLQRPIFTWNSKGLSLLDNAKAYLYLRMQQHTYIWQCKGLSQLYNAKAYFYYLTMQRPIAT